MLQVPWIMAVVAIVGLLFNAAGMVFGLFMLKSSLQFYEKGQEAIWAEILEIKKMLGLSNGGIGRYATVEKIQSMEEIDSNLDARLDAHSARLREVEIKLASVEKR